MKQISKLLMIVALMVSMIGVVSPQTASAATHVDNPFVGATSYINPDYAALIDDSIAQTSDDELAGKMETVKSYPTAVWIDRIEAIYGGDQNAGRRSLTEHLDAALAQKQGDTPITATFVIYNLPDRDCAALASNGTLHSDENGLEIYKTEYIDVIYEAFSDPQYEDVRIVTVIEPDSLPNLVTNLDDPDCAEVNEEGTYVEGIQYAIEKFSSLDNVYIYLDIAHSGWLGWDSNMGPAVDLYTDVVSGATPSGSLDVIDGFVSNVANYTPTEEPNLSDPNMTVGGQQLRSASFYEWNPFFDESDYVEELYQRFVSAGFPSDIGFLIDTSRNGWGGPDRPTEAVGSTVDEYVDSGRVDRRYHRGNWCNQDGAGIGYRPEAAPYGTDSHLDAFVWVKPPGESDGTSDSSQTDPDEEGKSYDPMCGPDYTTENGTPTGAMSGAPTAGHWFHEQFAMLVQNAYPEIGASDPQAPSAPTGVEATADDGQVTVSWSAVSGADSYSVKRSTASGGPYTTVASGLTETSYTDTGLTNGTTYYYVVSASNSIGESDNSAEVSATPSVPPAPGSFTLTATAGNGVVDLSWTESSNAAAYEVQRATSSGGPFTSLASGLTELSYSDDTVTNGTTYYYRVVASNSAGTTESNTEAATPEASLPGSFTLSAQAGNGQVELSWTASSGADAYDVQRSTDGTNFTAVAEDLTATSYTDTSVTNGTTYQYRVVAENSAGATESNVVEATPEAAVSSDLVLQYRDGDYGSANNNQIKPHFNIVNNGDADVPLSELTIRYYYTIDGAQSQQFHCDYSPIGCGSISGSFNEMSAATSDADYYLEISFSSAAGSVAAGSETGEIQARFNKSDWSNYDETNDFSYDGSKTSFADWDHVALYRNGQLVWGMEP